MLYIVYVIYSIFTGLKMNPVLGANLILPNKVKLKPTLENDYEIIDKRNLNRIFN